jgi:hypothetical protein
VGPSWWDCEDGMWGRVGGIVKKECGGRVGGIVKTVCGAELVGL